LNTQSLLYVVPTFLSCMPLFVIMPISCLYAYECWSMKMMSKRQTYKLICKTLTSCILICKTLTSCILICKTVHVEYVGMTRYYEWFLHYNFFMTYPYWMTLCHAHAAWHYFISMPHDILSYSWILPLCHIHATWHYVISMPQSTKFVVDWSNDASSHYVYEIST